MRSAFRYYQLVLAITYTVLIFSRDDFYMRPLLPLYPFLWMIPVAAVVWTIGSAMMLLGNPRFHFVCLVALGVLVGASVEMIRRKIFLVFEPGVIVEGMWYFVVVGFESLPLIPLYVAFIWLTLDSRRHSLRPT